jgi:Glycosyl hydrolases family 16
MRRVWIVIGLIMALLLAGSGTVLARAQRSRHEQAGTHHRRHRGRHVSKRHHKHGRHHKRRRHRRHRPKKKAPTSPPAATAPTPPPAPVAPAPGPCPSGPPASSQSVGGTTYALEGMDTFTKDAPLGSFAQSTNNQIVYTGDHGMQWTGYGDNWPSTYSGGAEGYQPSTVLSVHDGMLDFHLHNDTGGNPVGADPSPLPGGNRYQTYGVWSFCEKLAPADSHNLADFYQAPLLWPPNDGDSPSSESDFPEGNLAASDLSGFSHYGGSGSQDAFPIRDVIPSFTADQWHVYTQAWGPGFRSYYVDGQLVGTSTHQVWSGPERWQLQVEPSGTNDGDSGDVFVKWVWIGTPTS